MTLKSEIYSKHILDTKSNDLELKNSVETIVSSTVDASSNSHAALVVKGGLAVKKTIITGGDLKVEGVLYTNFIENHNSGGLNITGNNGIIITTDDLDINADDCDIKINGNLDISAKDIDILQYNLNTEKSNSFSTIYCNSLTNVVSMRNYNDEGHGISVSTSNFNHEDNTSLSRYLDLQFVHPDSEDIKRLFRIGAKNMRRITPQHVPSEWEVSLRSRSYMQIWAEENLELAASSIILNGDVTFQKGIRGVVSYHEGSPIPKEDYNSISGPSADNHSRFNGWFHPKLYTLAIEKRGRFCAAWKNLHAFNKYANLSMGGNDNITFNTGDLAFSNDKNNPPSEANIVGTFFELPFDIFNAPSGSYSPYPIYDINVMWKSWYQSEDNAVAGTLEDEGVEWMNQIWHTNKSLYGAGGTDPERGTLVHYNPENGGLIIAWRTDASSGTGKGNVAIHADYLKARTTSLSSPTWPTTSSKDYIFGAYLDIRILITYRKY